MGKDERSWIGIQVGDCVVDHLIGEGAYSWVYSATAIGGRSGRAVKVAKRAPDIGRPNADAATVAREQKLRQTRCRVVYTGGSSEVIPAGGLLLKAQYQKLTSTDDPALVAVHDGGLKNRTFCYAMDMVDGPTLREAMIDRPLPIQWLIVIGDGMARLEDDPQFRYHGDLKPDNVMIADAGVKLVDPGYFGGMQVFPPGTSDWSGPVGDYRDVAVTTPLYYPSLVPHDMFAFGLMLWELACGKHPLAGQISTGAAAGVFDMYKFAASDPPRRTNPQISEALEGVILKCLGLRVIDGRMQSGPEYPNFGEVSNALRALRASGIEEL